MGFEWGFAGLLGLRGLDLGECEPGWDGATGRWEDAGRVVGDGEAHQELHVHQVVAAGRLLSPADIREEYSNHMHDNTHPKQGTCMNRHILFSERLHP